MNISTYAHSSLEELRRLDTVEKTTLYQQANEENNIDLVRKLNEIGMKPEIPQVNKPGVISSYMDIATKHDTILASLQELRQNKQLLTEKEFETVKGDKKWCEKSEISRLLGANHLTKKINELKLQHIKVPEKVAVLKDGETLTITGQDGCDQYCYDFNSKQIAVYAEEIEHVNRKLTREEISELVQLIAHAHFTDLAPLNKKNEMPGNFILTKTDIYFIDTEFKSFYSSPRVPFGNFDRFLPSIREEDEAFFQDEVQKYAKTASAIPKMHYYLLDDCQLERYEKKKQEKTEKEKIEIEEIQKRMAPLNYVGAKVAGIYKPNQFSYPVTEILDSKK